MPTKRTGDLASLALLTLAIAAFFWPLFFAQAWIPRGGGDLVSFLWPMYRFAARSLRSGIVPLWNPHLYSGAPFVADNQSGVFYPVNLIVFLLLGPPSYEVMEALVVFHIWLAAVGTYVLLRSLRLRRSAATLGALAFALSDLFVTHIGNLNLNATAAWLPLILWTTHRALQGRSPGWAAAAGSMLAVAALSGHGQMLLFVGLLLSLYCLYYLAVLITAGHGPQPRVVGQTVAIAALIAAVGLGGAALTLLPAWQMTAHTGRGHLTYQEATRYSLPPRALIGVIAPGFHGRGVGDFWASWERVEVGYAGVVTLVLTAIGIGILLWSRLFRIAPRTPAGKLRRDLRDRRPFAFFALLVPVAFLLAMGRHTPLYRMLYRFVPIFDRVRAPARLIVLGDLGIAVMAAYGLDQLFNRRRSHRSYHLVTALIVTLVALLVLAVGLPLARSLPPLDRVPQASRSIIIAGGLLALSGVLVGISRWRSWTQWLFPLLLAADLVVLGSTVEIEQNDPTLGFFHPKVVAFLERDPSIFRIEDSTAAWQPDAALMHGLYDIGGVYNPLGLAPYEAYRWAIGEKTSPRYNLLGVKYVLTDKGEAPADDHLKLAFAGEDIEVYLNPMALPRAFFVTNRQVVSDHQEAWQAVHDPAFDPRQTVVLEEGVTRPSDRNREAHEPGRTSVVRYGLNRIELHVQAPVSGWLFLSDVYYPGWRASVDGRPASVLRANYTFRAVSVPAGEHTVEMAFVPRTWTLGLALSLATWLGLALATVRRVTRA